MTTETATNLVAWNGETYKGAGDYYDRIRADERFEDLDADEALRLAIYAYNCHANANGMDLEKLLEEEQEAYQGAHDSEADFCEQLVRDTEIFDLPDYISIDWQATWDTALRFDFFTYDVVTVDGEYVKFFWHNY